MKISVLGAGAVGSLLGGLLRRAGDDLDVLLIARSAHGRALYDRQRVLLDGPWGRFDVPVRCSLDPADIAGSDVVFVTVKSQGTEQAVRDAQPYWSNARVVSIQNGIMDRVLAQHVEPDRLVMGMTGMNVAVAEAGRVSLQLGGTTVLGPAIGHSATARQTAVADLLSRINCPGLSFCWRDDAMNLRYNKLAVNALGNASCLSGSNFVTESFACRQWREMVGLPLLDECRRVYRRAGIRLKRIPGMPGLPRLRIGMRLMRLPLVGAALNRRARRGFNRRPIVFSLLQDLKSGKATEVDHINGEVVRLARSLGLSAPVNEEVVRMVRELEQRGNGSLFRQEEVIDRLAALRA